MGETALRRRILGLREFVCSVLLQLVIITEINPYDELDGNGIKVIFKVPHRPVDAVFAHGRGVHLISRVSSGF